MEALQYSPLQQINKTNVSRLTQAWFYSVPGVSARFSYSPLIVDGKMYVLGSGKTLVCLDAATGKEIWSHPTEGTPTDRGINYWESKDRKDRRLIFAADSYLQEIDAQTGTSIHSFGIDGKINLREGLGRDPKTIPEIQTGTPGHVFENMIILGSATSESYGSPPGDIRAYDVLTGKTVWSFHTVPHPGEFGYDTWPKDAWKYVGGVNTWGEFAIDKKRAIGYFPLGSPTYDFWGGDRIGAGLYGDCLLALDLRTGKRLWYFQTVHHDLWDYDPTTAPKLLTVQHDGKTVDVVAQPTKTGFLFVFDRVSGKPLWPIEERPVPKSDAPGEESWPTQPVPTKPLPFARQSFTEKDIDPYLSEADKAHILEILRASNNQGIFTPGTDKRNSIQIPADDGGSNWGNGAADPKTGMVYLRTSDSPELKLKLSQKLPLRVPHGATLRYKVMRSSLSFAKDAMARIAPVLCRPRILASTSSRRSSAAAKARCRDFLICSPSIWMPWLPTFQIRQPAVRRWLRPQAAEWNGCRRRPEPLDILALTKIEFSPVMACRRSAPHGLRWLPST